MGSMQQWLLVAGPVDGWEKEATYTTRARARNSTGVRVCDPLALRFVLPAALKLSAAN
jgi:hypothetical protein